MTEIRSDELVARLEEALRRIERIEAERHSAPTPGKVETLDAVLSQLSHVVKRHESEISDFRRAIQSIAQLLEGALGATGLVRQVTELSKTVAINREEFIEFRNRHEAATMTENARALEPSSSPTGTIINQQNRLIEMSFKIVAVAAALLAAAAVGFGIKGAQPDTKSVPAQTTSPTSTKP